MWFYTKMVCNNMSTMSSYFKGKKFTYNKKLLRPSRRHSPKLRCRTSPPQCIARSSYRRAGWAGSVLMLNSFKLKINKVPSFFFLFQVE